MNRIYNEVANRHNTTAAEVEREIDYVISLAKQNPSPAARDFWGRVKNNSDVKDVICNIVSRLALVV